MSDLIKDGRKLSTAITAWVAKGDKLAREMHIIACSAIGLAVEHGRCDWLNQLYNGLPALMQDGLRAFCSSEAIDKDGNLIWFGADVEKPAQWLKYTKADGFKIVKGVPKPHADVVQLVADNFDLCFIHKTAKKTADALTFEAEIIKRVEAMTKYLQKKADERPELSATAQRMAELNASIAAMFTPGVVPVEQPVVH